MTTKHWTIASGNSWMWENHTSNQVSVVSSCVSIVRVRLLFFVVVFSSQSFQYQFLPIFHANTQQNRNHFCASLSTAVRSIVEWKHRWSEDSQNKYSHWTIQYVHIQIVENDLFIRVLRIAIVFVATSYFDGSHFSVRCISGVRQISARKKRWIPSQASPSVARACTHSLTNI